MNVSKADGPQMGEVFFLNRIPLPSYGIQSSLYVDGVPNNHRVGQQIETSCLIGLAFLIFLADNLFACKEEACAEIVELFVDVLERDGRFEVKTAGSGYDAGMITQEFMPDLIILDYMLPDINGNVVCQTIRKNPAFEHTKIVIVSGVVNQDEINDLLKSGADEFVKKPFNIEKLIERIGELLGV